MSSFPKRKEVNYSEKNIYIYFSFYHVFFFMIGILRKAYLIIEIVNIHQTFKGFRFYLENIVLSHLEFSDLFVIKNNGSCGFSFHEDRPQ